MLPWQELTQQGNNTISFFKDYCKKKNIEWNRNLLKYAQTDPPQKPPLPEDVNQLYRGPGGQYTPRPKQDDWQMPEISVPTEPMAPEGPVVSYEVRDLFTEGLKAIYSTTHELQKISERIVSLKQVLDQFYDIPVSFTTLESAFNTTFNQLSEIEKYFSDGSRGILNLKISQVDWSKEVPGPIPSIIRHMQDALDFLSRLNSQLQGLYEQAKGMEQSEDVRTFMWEVTYAFQVIRDSHNQLRSQFEKVYNVIPPKQLDKQEAPEIPESHRIKPPQKIMPPEWLPEANAPKAPVEIPYQDPQPKAQPQKQKPISPVPSQPTTPLVQEPKDKLKDTMVDMLSPDYTKWTPLDDKSKKAFDDLVSKLSGRSYEKLNKWVENTSPTIPTQIFLPINDGSNDPSRHLLIQKEPESKNITRFKIGKLTIDPSSPAGVRFEEITK